MTLKTIRTIPMTALLMVWIIPLAACSGGSGSSPTSPTAAGAESMVASLSTPWGEIEVQTNGHPVDFDRVYDSVVAGYDQGRSQVGDRVDGFRLDGYRLVVMPSDWGLNGQHLRGSREIRMRAGVERVMRHELQHLFAWELGRFDQCKTLQDHPGGYDLHCNPLT